MSSCVGYLECCNNHCGKRDRTTSCWLYFGIRTDALRCRLLQRKLSACPYDMFRKNAFKYCVFSISSHEFLRIYPTLAAALKALIFSIAAASPFLPIFLTDPGASLLMSLHRTTPSWRKSSNFSRSPFVSPVNEAIQDNTLASVSALRLGFGND